jgi:hypothetical protein
VIHREQVPAGWYATIRLRRGEALRTVTTCADAAAIVFSAG